MSDRLQINVELVTIGREILDGRVIDTNSVRMAEILKTRGLIVRHAQRVDDEIPRIVDAFRLAASRSQIILVTGGLGPTSDDLSIEAFAKFLNVPMNENAAALRVVETALRSRGREMTPAQRKQALTPDGVEVVANPNGTAPGLFLKRPSPVGEQYWALMPGVPREMIAMLNDDVISRLPGEIHYRTHQWATHFVAEATLQDRLQNLISVLPADFELSFRTRFPENHIGLHANCRTPESTKTFDKICSEITALLGQDSFFDAAELRELEDLVLEKARQSTTWLGMVESCTGGLLSKKFTSVPGASENFFAAWTTYHNAAKTALGVDRSLIERDGAVSESVARALAENGLKQIERGLGSQTKALCLSTTGVAGPGGGSPSKPVGLCFVGLARSGQATEVFEVRAPASLTRDQNQVYFAQKAMAAAFRSLSVNS
jgi:nicotinamide-nucleotide amidase